MVWINYNLLSILLLKDILGCFQFLSIMTSISKNIHVHVCVDIIFISNE